MTYLPNPNPRLRTEAEISEACTALCKRMMTIMEATMTPQEILEISLEILADLEREQATRQGAA